MREWLFNVMDELGERNELSTYYQDLQVEAKVPNKPTLKGSRRTKISIFEIITFCVNTCVMFRKLSPVQE